MIRRAWAVARKDMLIEFRSKVALNQVIPFALAVLLTFGFALDTRDRLLAEIAPGLFWVVVLFSSLYLIARSFRVERENSAMEGLILYGVDSLAIFLGKLAALAIQMLVLEAVAAAGIVILFNPPVGSLGLLTISALAATLAMGSIGLVYGALSSSEHSGESLLPLLVIPVLAPIVISAAKCWSDAESAGAGIYDPWLKIVAIFSAVFLAVGAAGFGPAMED